MYICIVCIYIAQDLRGGSNGGESEAAKFGPSL